MSLNIPSSPLKRIVIIGGGFAGIELVKRLEKSNFQIVLIDRNNYHQFQPLLYQVATAGLEPSSISFPLRKVFHDRKNLFIRLTTVKTVDPRKKQITTDLGELTYDFLVIATGAGNNYFGNPNIEDFCLPMKSVTESLRLRNAIFENFEKALTADNAQDRASYMNFVIVGGGPTGVELAGAIAEMRNKILPKDYPDLDFSAMKIILIQSSDRLLNAMSESSSETARQYLSEMGIELMFNTRVLDYDGIHVTLESGEPISTRSLIWAAGITGNSIEGLTPESYGPGGRVRVNSFNQSIQHPEIFVIGDIAMITDQSDYPNGHPQMAQPAIQQGKQLAANLICLSKNQSMEPFKYRDLGSMATIGRNKAVVELPKYKFKGFFAWLLWLVVHLRSILGIKNKLFILMNWTWNYFTYNLSLRLIIKNGNSRQERKP
jgi:NADH dehydrogenase